MDNNNNNNNSCDNIKPFHNNIIQEYQLLAHISDQTELTAHTAAKGMKV